ncbi:T9SS C-terminal target domain-containing protein [Aureitalea marina]|uniref:Secretion protein n=1 Tax=Aureitalea marina TaxID=930804 RepID=A0A2S7KRD0_9FLAO|nr:T9SS C-terminal target domain-containing protein [Aureitalea marina]PQB05184.1 hypothetical protein BST85_10045 [Aureitalea marina]
MISINKTIKTSLYFLFFMLTIACSSDDPEPTPDDNSDDTSQNEEESTVPIADLIIWQNSYGGNDGDRLQDLIVTRDNGFIFAGVSVSDASGDKTEDSRGIDDSDFWLIKTNSSGDILWDKTLGGSFGDAPYTVTETTEGEILVGGYSNSGISGDKLEPNLGHSDFWIVKLSANGEEIWQKTLGGSDIDRLISIVESPDGGLVLGGLSQSGASEHKSEKTIGDTGLFDYWVLKLDVDGNIEWENTIGGSDEDHLQAMVATNDGGYLLGGWSQSQPGFDKTAVNHGSYDYWLVKINANGDVVWDASFGGNNWEFLESMVQTSDGGFLIGGTSFSNFDRSSEKQLLGSNYWVVKINSSGTEEWNSLIGGSVDDFCYAVSESHSGGYVVGGWSQSGISDDKTVPGRGERDYWFIELDSEGAIIGQNVLGTSQIDELRIVKRASGNNYVLAGFSNASEDGDKTVASKGGFDFWVVVMSALY